MFIFEILLLLLFDIFIQICLTSGASSGKFSTAKSDECRCYTKGDSLHPELLNPQDHDLQRLVVYIYKDLNTNQVKIFTPSPEKQAILPNIPVGTNEELIAVTSETIASLINNPNNVIKYGEDPLKIDESHIDLLSHEMQNLNPNFLQFLNAYYQNYPEPKHIYGNFINGLTTLNLHNYGNKYINPDQIKGILNARLTFDQWIERQVATIRNDKLIQTQLKHKLTINVDILKSMVRKVLLENHMDFDSSGLITCADGTITNFLNLDLRYVLMAIPSTYTEALQENIITQDKMPYLEGILVTLINPPKTLGIIPLRNANVVETNSQIITMPDDYKGHYHATSKSSSNVTPNHKSESSLFSSSNINQASKISNKSTNPLTSGVKIPLHISDDNKSFMASGGLNPLISSWLRRSYKPLSNRNNIINITNHANVVTKVNQDLNNSKPFNDSKYSIQKELNLGNFNEPQKPDVIKNYNLMDQRSRRMSSAWKIHPNTDIIQFPTPYNMRQLHPQAHSLKNVSPLNMIKPDNMPSHIISTLANNKSKPMSDTTSLYYTNSNSPSSAQPDILDTHIIGIPLNKKDSPYLDSSRLNYLGYSLNSKFSIIKPKTKSVSEDIITPSRSEPTSYTNNNSSPKPKPERLSRYATAIPYKRNILTSEWPFYSVPNNLNNLVTDSKSSFVNAVPIIRNNNPTPASYPNNIDWTSLFSSPPFSSPHLNPKQNFTLKIQKDLRSALNLGSDSNIFESYPTEINQWTLPGSNKINPYYNIPELNDAFASGLKNVQDSHYVELQPISSKEDNMKSLYRQWKPLGYINARPSTKWTRKNNKRTLGKPTETTNSEGSSIKSLSSTNFDGINNVNKFGWINGEKIASEGSFPLSKNIVNSILSNFLLSLQNRAHDTKNRKNEKQPYITIIKPIEKNGDVQAEDRPDFRIIGGSAATSSGVPLSIKGRGRFDQS